jgi:ABC-2 type transport system permease protein
MQKPYSQTQAMLAITRASLRAIFRSPQAVFFSLFFPVVLIVIFGALTGRGGISLDVAFDKNCDTSNTLYHTLKNIPVLNVENADEVELFDRLKKGRITALIDIQKQERATSASPYIIHLKTTSAGQKDLPVLKSVIQSVLNSGSQQIMVEEIPGRNYKMIDFYLPGMIGFSLIGAAIFGVAFVFFAFRETLVLKRLYSTPIRRGYIVIGESIARVIFQMATVVVLILFGRFFYDFTLANGWITFAEMFLLCLLGLIVFMGFGYIISGISKNQNVIPIYANLFMFPQYFLSGTFFPKTALPEGMQKVIVYLPLTALNDGLRKISFEGNHLWNIGAELAILLVWCLVAYTIAIKVFRWE